MLMLIYYFITAITQNKTFICLGLFISSFYHEAHTNEERHLLCSLYFTMHNSNLETLFSRRNTHLFLILFSNLIFYGLF